MGEALYCGRILKIHTDLLYIQNALLVLILIQEFYLPINWNKSITAAITPTKITADKI